VVCVGAAQRSEVTRELDRAKPLGWAPMMVS
jgi:hypothetical protein